MRGWNEEADDLEGKNDRELSARGKGNDGNGVCLDEPGYRTQEDNRKSTRGGGNPRVYSLTGEKPKAIQKKKKKEEKKKKKKKKQKKV